MGKTMREAMTDHGQRSNSQTRVQSAFITIIYIISFFVFLLLSLSPLLSLCFSASPECCSTLESVCFSSQNFAFQKYNSQSPFLRGAMCVCLHVLCVHDVQVFGLNDPGQQTVPKAITRQSVTPPNKTQYTQ